LKNLKKNSVTKTETGLMSAIETGKPHNQTLFTRNAKMGEAMGPPSEHEDFSVVLGGPLYQFCMRTRLMRPTLGWVNRRITVSLLLTWVPLALLSALSGTLASGVAVPFLLDLTNLRLLVALPLMIGAEVFIHRRMRKVAQNFIDHGLISPTDQPRFEALIARTMWLRNSVVAELLMLVMSFTGGYALWRSFVTLGQIDTWYVVVRDGSTSFTRAGYWLAFVSLPIARFILLRWYYRLFVWYTFAWSVARFSLKLNPLHPDRAGGLGFLEQSVIAFAPILVAQSILLSSVIGDRIWHAGAKLPDFQLEIVGFVVIQMLVVLLPMLFFFVRMVEAKLVAYREMSLFASKYTGDFRRKWLTEAESFVDPLLGSADIQSLADLSNSFEIVRGMRALPVDKSILWRLLVPIGAPLAPLVLTMIPIDELVRRLIDLLV
jgi:hypothetical protein